MSACGAARSRRSGRPWIRASAGDGDRRPRPARAAGGDRQPGALSVSQAWSGRKIWRAGSSCARVLGGVTAVFEMPNTEPTTTDAEALGDKLARARGRMHCDHAFWVGGTQENAEFLRRAGAPAGVLRRQGVHGRPRPEPCWCADDLRAWPRSCATSGRRAAFHSEDEYRLAERRPLARTGDWTSHPEGARRRPRPSRSHASASSVSPRRWASASMCYTSPPLRRSPSWPTTRTWPASS